jgi:type IV pilus assembly protein PilO
MRERILSRHKLLLTGLTAVTALCCFAYFILVPQVKAYNQTKNELAADNDALSKAQTAAASINSESDRLNKVWETYEAKSGPFKTAAGDGSDIVFLGLAAASGGIAAAEIVPGDIIENNHTLELPLKVVMEGDYRSLVDFFSEIESSSSVNILEIRSLKFETITQKPGAKGADAVAKPGTVKATAGIVMYSVKDPEGKLHLEEMSKWLTGRGDVFRPPDTPKQKGG